ncbi:hypothetical protein [Roseovarius Plymouth podovirus 1]|uniref:Uncharacterized protein n=1 Tax=Roseovarius Plymouth podovirus 1 TaxID=926474 RepID=K4Q5A6_9CAUD|nr:hypothetical protein HYO70_gp87 [Roseovarius Plymouth podovirus 1]CBX88017.1 hypothetical protein [Roseovarius Plymouth podovirus 1]
MVMKDNESLADKHTTLMNDIMVCDNMIDPDSEDQNEQAELQSELEDMCQELDVLETVMSLKWAVDCDCFYR